MKALYVTPWAPSLRNGGGRHAYANLRALTTFAGIKVDYVGPPWNEELTGLDSRNFGRVFSRHFTAWTKIGAVWRLAATSLVGTFGSFVKAHGPLDHELVFVEGTRCGFVFSYVPKGSQAVVSVQNVEFDYVFNDRLPYRRVLAGLLRRSERTTWRAAQAFLVMHQHDQRRLFELYGQPSAGAKLFIHPACSFAPNVEAIPLHQRPKTMAFVGSLDANFNLLSLKAFLSECWPLLRNSGWKLVVAGKNPPPSLIGLIARDPTLELIENPADMAEVLRNARLLILPDLSGTGMKLRVAEALSLGVPIMGTEQGLRGYTNVSSFGVEVASLRDMVDAIQKLMNDPATLERLSFGARRAWESHYSFDAFEARLHRILAEVTRTEQK